jgi:hypothetical protein
MAISMVVFEPFLQPLVTQHFASCGSTNETVSWTGLDALVRHPMAGRLVGHRSHDLSISVGHFEFSRAFPWVQWNHCSLETVESIVE